MENYFFLLTNSDVWGRSKEKYGFSSAATVILESHIPKSTNAWVSAWVLGSLSVYIQPFQELKQSICPYFNCYLQANANGSNSGQCYHMLVNSLRALVVVYGFHKYQINSLCYSQVWKPLLVIPDLHHYCHPPVHACLQACILPWIKLI